MEAIMDIAADPSIWTVNMGMYAFKRISSVDWLFMSLSMSISR